MKKYTILILITFLLVFTGCSKKQYNVSDYKIDIDYKENFKIMQLTDIHLGVESDYQYEINHLENMINSQNDIDLIVITGDTFTYSNKEMVKKFFGFIDKFNIKWTFTYGNHDLQGDYDTYFINDIIKQTKNKLFIDYDDDDITGLTNFYINIKKDEINLYRLYIVDSNTYYNSGIKYCYDIIHEDQIKHIENINEYENDNAIGLVFFHIPLYEFIDANNEYEKENVSGTGKNNEDCCVGYKKTDAFKRFKNMNIKGLFIGHDHINNATIYYNDMILSYGLKATDVVYYDSTMIGYKLITLPSNPLDFSLDNVKDVYYGY